MYVEFRSNSVRLLIGFGYMRFSPCSQGNPDPTKWFPPVDDSWAGQDVSAYHVEAAMTAVHASAHMLQETDWPAITSTTGS